MRALVPFHGHGGRGASFYVRLSLAAPVNFRAPSVPAYATRITPLRETRTLLGLTVLGDVRGRFGLVGPIVSPVRVRFVDDLLVGVRDSAALRGL